jgi:hypothetical protein
MNIEMQRRHAQIQIALIMIGQQLGFRIWIAQNDKGIICREKRLGEMQGVIPAIRNERFGLSRVAAAAFNAVILRTSLTGDRLVSRN